MPSEGAKIVVKQQCSNTRAGECAGEQVPGARRESLRTYVAGQRFCLDPVSRESLLTTDGIGVLESLLVHVPKSAPGNGGVG